MTIQHPLKIAHVVYRTHQYDLMLNWYQQVFNAKIMHKEDVLAFLTYDDEHHRLAFINLDLLSSPGSATTTPSLVGVDHVAYTYASLPSLLENYQILKKKNIAPYWCVHHGISASLYYADPDGNQLEFSVDAHTNHKDAASFIHSQVFSNNPVGVEFDPDDWITQIADGIPVSTFLNRPSEEPVSPIRGALGDL